MMPIIVLVIVKTTQTIVLINLRLFLQLICLLPTDLSIVCEFTMHMIHIQLKHSVTNQKLSGMLY